MNAARYLLAIGGVGLAVLLVSTTLTGVSMLRRVGARPITQFAGGDIMVMSGALDLSARPGGVFADLPALKVFDPQELLRELPDLRVTRNLLITTYAYPYGQKQGAMVTLLGRSPIDNRFLPTLYTGRLLSEDDEGLPRVVVPRGEQFFSGLSAVRMRIPAAIDGREFTTDLARGTDYELEIIGTTAERIGNDLPYVPLSFLQKAVGTDEVLWLGVKVDDPAAVDRVAERVRRAAPEFTVLTTAQILETIDVESAKLQRAAVTIISLALVVGCLAVVNTLLTVIRLRRREVALMKAIGIGPKAIVAVFMVEALSATGLGTLGGYLLGSFLGSAFGQFGMVFSLNTFLYVVALAMAVTLLSIALPTVWATRYSVLEVMRND